MSRLSHSRVSQFAFEHFSIGFPVIGEDMRDSGQLTSSAAEALPFDCESFDAAVSQFGLMLFDDKKAATTEMWRVLRPGGRLAIAVWDSLDNSPGYASLAFLLTRVFGASTAALLQAPFTLGDPHALGSLLTARCRPRTIPPGLASANARDIQGTEAALEGPTSSRPL